MPRDTRPLAERLRAHREAFERAQQEHCTPQEAAEKIARVKARAAWAESQRKLIARQHTSPAEAGRPRFWWQKD